MEMDPTAPGYIKLQKTPWLFAILKSTEPYLEEYFNMAPKLQSTLRDIGERMFYSRTVWCFDVMCSGLLHYIVLCCFEEHGLSVDAHNHMIIISLLVSSVNYY